MLLDFIAWGCLAFLACSSMYVHFMQAKSLSSENIKYIVFPLPCKKKNTLGFPNLCTAVKLLSPVILFEIYNRCEIFFLEKIEPYTGHHVCGVHIYFFGREKFNNYVNVQTGRSRRKQKTYGLPEENYSLHESE